MLKLETLRALIMAAVPRYKNEPAQVIVMTDGGEIISTGTDSLSHEMHYTALVWVLGLSEHPDTVLVPVLAWHKAQQAELYASPGKTPGAFKFHTQLLDDTRCIDLHLRLKISERVIVAIDHATGLVTTSHHAPEPLPIGYSTKPERWQLDLLHPDGEREHLGTFDGPPLRPNAHTYLAAMGIK